MIIFKIEVDGITISHQPDFGLELVWKLQCLCNIEYKHYILTELT